MVDNIDIASYADDRNKLQIASVKFFKWFHENGLKANKDEC